MSHCSFRRSQIFVLPFLLSSFCPTAPNAYSASPTPQQLPVPATFNSKAGRGEPLLLTLRVADEKEVLFVVDTGSPITILDESLKHVVGKPIGAAKLKWPTGLKGSTKLYFAPTIYLGDTPLLTGERVAIFDLQQFQYPGGRFKGILGTDCLSHYCLQLDFASCQIKFLRPEDLNPQNLGKAFPISVSPGMVFVQGNLLSSGKTKAQIDTGDLTDGAVKPAVFKSALIEQRVAVTNGMNSGTPVARFPLGMFAGEPYLDLLIAEERGRGFIGLRFLARHLVTFDFPNRTLYLKRLP